MAKYMNLNVVLALTYLYSLSFEKMKWIFGFYLLTTVFFAAVKKWTGCHIHQRETTAHVCLCVSLKSTASALFVLNHNDSDYHIIKDFINLCSALEKSI